MIKIAIVGNIASGKSTVEKMLADKGYSVYDTDKIAHKILETSPEVKTVFGTIDRKQIANIVFSNNEMLKKLESIIHPQVKNELLKIFSKESGVVFVSVPQLFESNMENLFDKIIYITADKDIRKKRLIKRNNISPEEAEIRILAQNEDKKAEKSDFVIENNKDLKSLEFIVNNFLDLINNL